MVSWQKNTTSKVLCLTSTKRRRGKFWALARACRACDSDGCGDNGAGDGGDGGGGLALVVVMVVTMVVSIKRGNRSLPTVLDTYMVVGNLCPHVIKFIDWNLWNTTKILNLVNFPSKKWKTGLSKILWLGNWALRCHAWCSTETKTATRSKVMEAILIVLN